MNFITFSVLYKNSGLFLCILHIRSHRGIQDAYSVYRGIQSKHRNSRQQDCPLHR